MAEISSLERVLVTQSEILSTALVNRQITDRRSGEITSKQVFGGQ